MKDPEMDLVKLSNRNIVTFWLKELINCDDDVYKSVHRGGWLRWYYPWSPSMNVRLREIGVLKKISRGGRWVCRPDWRRIAEILGMI